MKNHYKKNTGIIVTCILLPKKLMKCNRKLRLYIKIKDMVLDPVSKNITWIPFAIHNETTSLSPYVRIMYTCVGITSIDICHESARLKNVGGRADITFFKRLESSRQTPSNTMIIHCIHIDNNYFFRQFFKHFNYHLFLLLINLFITFSFCIRKKIIKIEKKMWIQNFSNQNYI